MALSITYAAVGKNELNPLPLLGPNWRPKPDHHCKSAKQRGPFMGGGPMAVWTSLLSNYAGGIFCYWGDRNPTSLADWARTLGGGHR